MKSISLSTLAGIFLGFGLFVFSIMANTNTYGIFWSISSLLLVLGGTLAATMISYEGRYVWKALLTLGQVIVPTQVNHKVLYQEVSQVIAWGKIGARDGLPGLEKEFEKLQGHEDPFLHHCIQLLMAGYSQDDLRGKLTTAMDSQYERQMVQAGILNTMANIAPGFGMIGTLVGLMIMLGELDGNTSNIGMGLALALITTLYGVILAQLVFKPAARRAEQKEQICRFRNQLMIDAFLLLVNRSNSLQIQDHLNSFLDPAIRFNSAQHD